MVGAFGVLQIKTTKNELTETRSQRRRTNKQVHKKTAAPQNSVEGPAFLLTDQPPDAKTQTALLPNHRY